MFSSKTTRFVSNETSDQRKHADGPIRGLDDTTQGSHAAVNSKSLQIFFELQTMTCQNIQVNAVRSEKLSIAAILMLLMISVAEGDNISITNDQEEYLTKRKLFRFFQTRKPLEKGTTPDAQQKGYTKYFVLHKDTTKIKQTLRGYDDNNTKRVMMARNMVDAIEGQLEYQLPEDSGATDGEVTVILGIESGQALEVEDLRDRIERYLKQNPEEGYYTDSSGYATTSESDSDTEKKPKQKKKEAPTRKVATEEDESHSDRAHAGTVQDRDDPPSNPPLAQTLASRINVAQNQAVTAHWRCGCGHMNGTVGASQDSLHDFKPRIENSKQCGSCGKKRPQLLLVFGKGDRVQVKQGPKMKGKSGRVTVGGEYHPDTFVSVKFPRDQVLLIQAGHLRKR